MREASVWVSLNGTRRILLACAPHELPALVLGHLLAEGWVDDAADVSALREETGPGGAVGVAAVVAAARLDAALEERAHRLSHGCGLRHTLDCSTAARTVAGDVPTADFPALFRSLFAASDAASPDGGVHAVALSRGAVLDFVAVDVARHCAVDRVIGLALLSREAPAECGLVLTSRVSAAIVLKAARARIGWIASRSVATPLAQELAERHGVVVVERAARGRGR